MNIFSIHFLILYLSLIVIVVKHCFSLPNVIRIEREKESLENTTIRMTTIITEPYTMIKESSNLAGNDRYEGFAIDLISELSKLLQFKYSIHLVKDNAYGNLDEKGMWNGMIGEIIRDEADIAVADFTITRMRSEAVDFTQPFMNTGISILFKKPTNNVSTIKNVEDLAAQEIIKYGCVASGSTASFFRESNITTYKKMWHFMSKHQKDVLVNSNHAGVHKVKSSDGMYAFLMESVSIEYRVERYCDLTQIGCLLDSKGYGIATKKDFPLRNLLSQAILHLSEVGTIHILKNRWWKQKRGGGHCLDHSKQGFDHTMTGSVRGSVNQLKIDSVRGVFEVLIGWFLLALFVEI